MQIYVNLVASSLYLEINKCEESNGQKKTLFRYVSSNVIDDGRPTVFFYRCEASTEKEIVHKVDEIEIKTT
jgi:hypothetical protein